MKPTDPSTLDAPALTAHDWVYQRLRTAIMEGRLEPGRGVTLRGIAADLEVSPTPVREALRRLAAEGAVVVLENRRVAVPEMSGARFTELVEARIALETAAAERALPAMGDQVLDRLAETDRALDAALAEGRVEDALRYNRAFHLTLYQANPSQILVPMIETVWLRLGPFIRMATRNIGQTYLTDRHVEAMDAIARRDSFGLRAAIEADIRDGMGKIGREELRAAQPSLAGES